MSRSDRKRDGRLEKGKGNRRINIVTLQHPVEGQVGSSAMEFHS